MDEIILYDFPSSYYCQMVRLAFLEKGIPYTKIHVNILRGEGFEPAFVHINPACEVPALTVNGKPLSAQGSQEIIRYLDTIKPPVPEYTDAVDQERVEEFRLRCSALPVGEITFGIVRHPHLLAGAQIPKHVQDSFSNRVDRREVLTTNIVKYSDLADSYRATLARVVEVENHVDEQSLRTYLHDLELFLDDVERQLAERARLVRHDSSRAEEEWLFGPQFTNADIVLACLLARLDLLGRAGTLWDTTDRVYLTDYYRRLKQRPSFQQECLTRFPDDP